MKGLLLTVLLGTTAVYGQSATRVTDALASIREHDNLLGVAYDNIQGMSVGQDQAVLASASDTINLMRMSDGAVIAVANLVRHMRDPEDLAQVRGQLQYTLTLSLKHQDIAVKTMNGYMTLIKGPAALAEVTKARDEMIAIRAAMQSIQIDAGASAPSSQ